jgi:pyruvate dehydrogenase E1 component
VYQARFNRYLEDRGLTNRTGRVWCFAGDGEMDEPEALGCIGMAGRENLDNLTFVVNCNLQRLDGPVRGNRKIIEDLETLFRGAGWEVIKVVWGADWDPLFEKDEDGVLIERLAQAVDGDFQKYSVESGAYIRQHFFGTDPRLKQLVAHLSDEALQKLRRGGHDPEKVYAAYAKAVAHKGSPTVILAHTIKGYGLGEAGEGRNITHQQKKLNEEELRAFRSRFGIPISDEQVSSLPFYRPSESSAEIRYLKERREALGGFVPERVVAYPALSSPEPELFEEFYSGGNGREASTTMMFVRMLAKLLKDPNLGPRIVPIIPDEARTFGMDALFRQVGIYSHTGQRYEPVDRDTLLYYKEDTRGQILEEGITEAGALSSFIAAGTSYATHGIAMLPFFVFYSMFGFQRVGDLIWAAGDMRARGFLIGGTAGRTTLAGEGLQHQDGNSHLLAYPCPHVVAYDPAFAYEIAVILRHGIQRMYQEDEDVIYYLTVANETYPMPPMPEGSEDGILRGMYRVAAAGIESGRRVQLLGSGPILREALRAKEILESEFRVAADVWSVTSYKNLHRDGLEKERRNRLHPTAQKEIPFVAELLGPDPGVVVAASDYVKALPASIAKWIPGRLVLLGTDGFGRSEDRGRLRDFFEVSAEHIAAAAIAGLADEGTVTGREAEEAIEKLHIDPDRPDPFNRDK